MDKEGNVNMPKHGYQCDGCHSLHDTEEQALHCESTHPKPISLNIASVTYNQGGKSAEELAFNQAVPVSVTINTKVYQLTYRLSEVKSSPIPSTIPEQQLDDSLEQA